MEHVPLADRRNCHVEHISIPVAAVAPIQPLTGASQDVACSRTTQPPLRRLLLAGLGLLVITWALAQGVRTTSLPASVRTFESASLQEPFEGIMMHGQ